MILYLDDWKKYPSAIPHYSTSNKSWVRLAGVYHKMGIKNCLFHLALHNPELANIDPHDPNLTQEQIAMIIEEAAENPWYVLRELIRLPPIASDNPIPLRANRGNISLYWLYFNHVTTMLIQPRQTGKSVSTDALMTALITILTIKYELFLLTKDDSLRTKNVKRIKELINYLPSYFQLRTKKDTNNNERITIERLGNVYSTAVPQASKRGALNVGRGMTVPTVHIDEIAFIVNIDITLPALLAASVAAREEAERAGSPYGIIFTTTPGYLSTNSGKYAYEIYNESFRWTELLFDSTNREELYEAIKSNSSSGKLQVLLDYNHRQLGYTDEWLKERISVAMASGEAVEADFLGIWPEGSGSSLIPKELMKVIIRNRINDANNMITTYGYIVKWYIPLEEIKNRQIVGGLDTSEAIGKDGIGLVLRDVRTGEVLGAGDFNETNTVTFSKWLAEFLMEYENVTLVIERKNTGVSIIDGLIEILVHNGIDPFKRLFNWVVNDSRIKKSFREEVVDVPFYRRDPDVYIKYRKHFGYTTTGSGRSSRDMLYGEIFNASIKYTAETIRDPKLINQLSGLVVKNNRIDHKQGSHDDLVIAWLLGYWFLTKGENLEFYNISPHKVLTSVTEAIIEEQGGREAIEKREYQLALKAEIDSLIEKIKNEPDPVKTKLLINKIKYLYKEIDTSIIQTFNIDALLENIEIEKNKESIPYYKRRWF